MKAALVLSALLLAGAAQAEVVKTVRHVGNKTIVTKTVKHHRVHNFYHRHFHHHG